MIGGSRYGWEPRGRGMSRRLCYLAIFNDGGAEATRRIRIPLGEACISRAGTRSGGTG